RRGRPLEALARAGLVALAARLGTAARIGGTPCPVGRAQMHLASEALAAAIIVAAGRRRSAARLARRGSTVIGPRGRLGMAVTVGARRRRSFVGSRHNRSLLGRFGLVDLALGRFLGIALGLLDRFGAALVRLGQRLLLGQVALPGFFQL